MPIFPLGRAQAANFWSHRGFEWKAINKEMGSFLILSLCVFCHAVLQYRRGRKKLLRCRLFETGCYLPVSLDIVQLARGMLFAKHLSGIDGSWKCFSGPLQSWWWVKPVADLIFSCLCLQFNSQSPSLHGCSTTWTNSLLLFFHPNYDTFPSFWNECDKTFSSCL